MAEEIITTHSAQQKVLTQLQQVIAQNRLAQGLVFVGPCVRSQQQLVETLAQTLLCERITNSAITQPCGQCGSCLRVQTRQSESVLWIQPEEGAIKIEAARTISEFLSLRALRRRRLVVLNEATALTPQAANALLKVLEEPPPDSYFFLTATTVTGLLPTIRSRVQTILLPHLSSQDIQQILGVTEWVARAARGRLDVAASLSDESALQARTLAITFLTACRDGSREALSNVRDQVRERPVALQTAHFLQQLLQDVCLLKHQLSVCHSDQLELLQSLTKINKNSLIELTGLSLSLEQDIDSNLDRPLAFEHFFFQTQAHMRSARC